MCALIEVMGVIDVAVRLCIQRQVRTSEDHEHTIGRICLVTCGNAGTAVEGRVTTGLGALSVTQSGPGTVKSKNRAGSGSSRAVRIVFCPGVVAERWATRPSVVARVTRQGSGAFRDRPI
jgi:hypothetical protein